MNMIGRHRPPQDLDLPGRTDLPDQLPGPKGHIPAYDLVARLRNPDQMILDVIEGVPPAPIFDQSVSFRSYDASET